MVDLGVIGTVQSTSRTPNSTSGRPLTACGVVCTSVLLEDLKELGTPFGNQVRRSAFDLFRCMKLVVEMVCKTLC
ncbi:hypothetical protein LSAT2_022115 [Lamellibrachia satsuma]|nr:hypothetical protein LSAT2_022115 [Lamellibrachia satsuma]